MGEVNLKYINTAYNKFISHLIYPWKRKGVSILQIGKCDFFSPLLFFQENFDTSVFYPIYAKRDSDSLAQNSKLEIHTGDFSDLPFQDGEFNYSLIFLDDVWYSYKLTTSGKENQQNFTDFLISVLSETSRVTTKGITIISSKKFFLFSHSQDCSKTARQFKWGEKDKILTDVIEKIFSKNSVDVTSILNLPPFFWGSSVESSNIFRKAINYLCFLPLPFSFGLLQAMSFDLKKIPLTPSGTLKTILAAFLPKKTTEPGISSSFQYHTVAELQHIKNLIEALP